MKNKLPLAFLATLGSSIGIAASQATSRGFVNINWLDVIVVATVTLVVLLLLPARLYRK
jgi:hypothetical protein